MIKILVALGMIAVGSTSFAKSEKASARKLAGQAKATLCHAEAAKYASTIASDVKATIRKGKLEMFDNIGEVPVEGWSFSTSQGKTIVIVASADGGEGENEVCRLFVVYNR